MSYEVQLFTDPETRQEVVLAEDYNALAASHRELVEAMEQVQKGWRTKSGAELKGIVDAALRNAEKIAKQ